MSCEKPRTLDRIVTLVLWILGASLFMILLGVLARVAFGWTQVGWQLADRLFH